MNIKRLKLEYRIILIFAIVKLIINTVADINGGFNGDEVMHIDSGHHLAWGYITFQPMMGILAYIQNLFHSHSIFVHHLFVHVAAELIIIFSGLCTLRLGGSWKAVLMTLVCIVGAPGYGITNNSFMPLVFEQLFWVLSFYYLISYSKQDQVNYLFYLALALGIGFLAKISILFLVAGIFISILLFDRHLLGRLSFWLALCLFVLIISPNVLWQFQHDFPVFGHMSVLRDKVLTKIDEMKNFQFLFLSLNPLAAPVWISGIFIVPFTTRFKNMRFALFSVSFPFLLLILARSQFYYLFPTMLCAFCVGSVYLEQRFISRKGLLNAYFGLISLLAVFIIPLGITLFPRDFYIKYGGFKKKNNILFFNQEALKNQKENVLQERIPLNYEEYYTTTDWNKLVKSIAKIYADIDDNHKKGCVIWTLNYIQAGAINFLGDKYGLPRAFTFHASYFDWIPKLNPGVTVIAVGQSARLDGSAGPAGFFGGNFDSIELKCSLFCPYARESQDSYYHVFLCNGLKFDDTYLKENHKVDIF